MSTIESRSRKDPPRAEVGQGLTTAMAMIIAEEMSVPLSKVWLTAVRRPSEPTRVLGSQGALPAVLADIACVALLVPTVLPQSKSSSDRSGRYE